MKSKDKVLRVNTSSVKHTVTPLKVDPRLVAASQENDLYQREVYVPDTKGAARPGADDHLAYKSFGNLT